MSLQGITDVQVGDTVTIGQQETFVPEIFLYTPDTPARLGVQPGINIVTFQFSEWLSRMVVVLLERSTVISLL